MPELVKLLLEDYKGICGVSQIVAFFPQVTQFRTKINPSLNMRILGWNAHQLNVQILTSTSIVGNSEGAN